MNPGDYHPRGAPDWIVFFTDRSPLHTGVKASFVQPGGTFWHGRLSNINGGVWWRSRHRGGERGDRQVMPFDTIDLHDTPGRRLWGFLRVGASIAWCVRGGVQHFVNWIICVCIREYGRRLYQTILGAFFSPFGGLGRNVSGEDASYKNTAYKSICTLGFSAYEMCLSHGTLVGGGWTMALKPQSFHGCLLPYMKHNSDVGFLWPV